ncbi:UNVERIFIED_CONTAM: hypothetical protein GTU68_011552 [Idotea baltica]|nr:hypothetical protein [Idotea baltica]
MIQEFKKFIMKGNVLDLAVALIIGGAFGKIITSFVKDVLMPPIGLALGGVDFTDLKIVLSINYGSFIQTIVDFLIVAFAIFMVVKAYNSAQKKEEEAPAAPPAPSAEEVLLTEIRDALRKQN